MFWTLDKLPTAGDRIIAVKGYGSLGLSSFPATGNVHGESLGIYSKPLKAKKRG